MSLQLFVMARKFRVVLVTFIEEEICGGAGSSGPGSSPGRNIVLCSWARHFALTVPLSTQAPVARKVDNAIRRINHYSPADKC